MAELERAEDPGQVERVASWVYEGLWGVLAKWLRTPREGPTLPAHDDESVEVFHPSPGWLRMRKMWFWIGLVVVDLVFLTLWGLTAIVAWWLALVLAPLFLALIVLPDIVAYIAIHLRYDVTWYVLTDRSVRLRHGVWTIHETTFTFENVQNVRVQSGPVERYFGVGRVLIDTAGGGSGEGGVAIGHRGVIEGVSNASEIRDRIMARVRASKGAGLGDERHEEHDAPSGAGLSGEHVAVLREILAEVRGTPA